MQWILQQFEDTQKLADALDRLDISYSWHKVVPFIGELVPSLKCATRQGLPSRCFPDKAVRP